MEWLEGSQKVALDSRAALGQEQTRDPWGVVSLSPGMGTEAQGKLFSAVCSGQVWKTECQG